ncbi:MAG: hypothetical protein K2L34_02105 [Muribaculaceae bacterium]|nr:hypothetical protein [Muribaculaceae bacterium]
MYRSDPLWKALGFTSLMMGVGAVMAGNSSAQIHGNAEFFPATICLIFVIFAQLAANSYTRYREVLYSMGYNTHIPVYKANNSTPGYDKALFYRVFSVGLGLVSLIAGLTLVSMGGIWFALVGVFILVTAWLMVGGSTPLLLSPWGCVFTFILFGPVTVISTSMLQSAHEATDPLSWFDISPALFMSGIVGFMSANAYLVYVYGNYYMYKKTMGDTFTPTFGRKATRVLVLINSFLAFGIYVWASFYLSLDNPWVAAAPSVVCFIFNIYIWWEMKHLPKYKLLTLADLACLNVLIMGVLASIVAAFVGIPDDSHMQVF